MMARASRPAAPDPSAAATVRTAAAGAAGAAAFAGAYAVLLLASQAGIVPATIDLAVWTDIPFFARCLGASAIALVVAATVRLGIVPIERSATLVGALMAMSIVLIAVVALASP